MSLFGVRPIKVFQPHKKSHADLLNRQTCELKHVVAEPRLASERLVRLLFVCLLACLLVCLLAQLLSGADAAPQNWVALSDGDPPK